MENQHPTHRALIRMGELQVGDILVVRSVQEMQEEFGENWREEVECTFLPAMDEFCGRLELTVTPSTLEYIRTSGGHGAVFRDQNKYWSLDMLKAKNPRVVADDDKIEYKKISIRKEEKDPKIIEKMISLVDIKRFESLLKLAANHPNRRRRAIKKDVVQQLIERWAESKYDYFLMFGEQLKIVKEVEFEMDEQQMRDMRKKLSLSFPKYGMFIDLIRPEDYIRNELSYYHEFEHYAPTLYKKGMKVSKFLSTFLEDKQLDIELSKILQYKFVKGYVEISIDPYDYLTSSVNKHGWRSCHHISDGEYATGPVSYMVDDSTLIAYKHNGHNFHYDINKVKFTGNSKQWRQVLHFDKDSCSFIASRSYPGSSNELEKHARDLLEKQISSYTNVEDTWQISKGFNLSSIKFNKVGSLQYCDVSSRNSILIRNKFTRRENIVIKVGVKTLPCLVCGDEFEDASGPCRCEDCC